MDAVEKLGSAFVVFMLAIILVGTIGWVKNIIKLAKCDFEAPYKAEIVYGVGVIPAVGAITGWIDVGK